MIERSHLAFCSQLKKSDCLGVDNPSSKMFRQMLQQIYRMTDPIVDGITTESYPTMRSLFEAYEEPGMNQRQKNELLVGASVSVHVHSVPMVWWLKV